MSDRAEEEATLGVSFLYQHNGEKLSLNYDFHKEISYSYGQKCLY